MNRLTEYMLPPARSTLASETDALFHFINVTSIILLVGITIAILYFAWKYRRKSEDDVTPVITHNNKLEITWSVIPLIMVMIVFGWGFHRLHEPHVRLPMMLTKSVLKARAGTGDFSTITAP